MFGKLTWGAIPFDQPIPLFAGAFVIVMMIGVLALSRSRAGSRICGANGSPASTTSGSASCT